MVLMYKKIIKIKLICEISQVVIDVRFLSLRVCACSQRHATLTFGSFLFFLSQVIPYSRV